MSKLLSQGAYGCVYYPGIDCNGNEDKKRKYVTKLQKKGYNSDNEINIGLIVRQLKNFFYIMPQL